MTMTKELIYLASPYSHVDSSIMEQRHKEVCELTAFWKSRGYHIYCPIAETVAIAQYGKIHATDWEYWRDDDLLKLSKCDQLWICMMDGWKDSKGVRGEIKYAIQTKKPIALANGFQYVAAVSYESLLHLISVENVDELND